jgi:hypothetical protein
MQRANNKIKIKIICQNVRGLNNTNTKPNKQKDVKQIIQENDIIILTETHTHTEHEEEIKSKYKIHQHQVIFTHNKTKPTSGGMMVIVKNKIKINRIIQIDKIGGRYILFNIKQDKKLLHIMAVYAPATQKERIDFYTNKITPILEQKKNQDYEWT